MGLSSTVQYQFPLPRQVHTHGSMSHACNRGPPFVTLLFLLKLFYAAAPIGFVHVFELWNRTLYGKPGTYNKRGHFIGSTVYERSTIGKRVQN